jgi:SAM-dependent methyltransferase
LIALFRQAGGQIGGCTFVEVGTGWCPWLPLLLSVGGARRIVTVDLHPWLSRETALSTTRAFLERRRHIAQALDLDEALIEPTLAPALSATSLHEWLDSVRIVYMPRTELHQASLESGSIDAVVSSNVLEHVTPEGLRAIHQESARLLRSGGLVAHRFNPQDHFSFSDDRITGANFLKFSESQWRRIGGSGLAYHNRLRCRHHLEMIRAAGLDVTIERTRADATAERAIRSGALTVHQDFRGLSPKELTDDYMWVAARKPAGAAPSN